MEVQTALSLAGWLLAAAETFFTTVCSGYQASPTPSADQEETPSDLYKTASYAVLIQGICHQLLHSMASTLGPLGQAVAVRTPMVVISASVFISLKGLAHVETV